MWIDLLFPSINHIYCGQMFKSNKGLAYCGLICYSPQSITFTVGRCLSPIRIWLVVDGSVIPYGVLCHIKSRLSWADLLHALNEHIYCLRRFMANNDEMYFGQIFMQNLVRFNMDRFSCTI